MLDIKIDCKCFYFCKISFSKLVVYHSERVIPLRCNRSCCRTVITTVGHANVKIPAQGNTPHIIIVIGRSSLLNNVRETHTLEMIPKSMICCMACLQNVYFYTMQQVLVVKWRDAAKRVSFAIVKRDSSVWWYWYTQLYRLKLKIEFSNILLTEVPNNFLE